ncbi:ABC transporter permease subunit [Candidatus Saccharibacteria bacterium]|nr:MAG: ABC transporter permease subunit [Candidatus Saccharibacteria bacterium]
MKDVIVWELRQRRKAIFWWTFASVIMTAVILALFPSIRDQAAEMNKVINTLPPELRGLKTGGANNIDVGDPLQFLNSQLFYATLPLIWMILAITRGAGLLGREEQTHTLELLLARPISRARLLIAKIIAFCLEFTTVTMLTFTTILLLCPIFELNVGASRLFSATAYTTLFCFSFGLIALTLHAASRLTKRAATAFAVTLAFGGYLLASLSSLTDWLEVPVKFMPYHYFTPLDALSGKTPRGLVVYLVCVFLISGFLAIVGFRKRDIE